MDTHLPPAKQPVSTGQAQSAASKPKSSGWRWFWLLLLVVAGTAGWYMWSKGGLTPAAAGSAPPKGGKKGGGAVPVVAVKAHKGNIGVYINGLGNITPIYTDMVKSRVDGELMDV